MEVIWAVPYYCAWRGVGFVYCLPLVTRGDKKSLVYGICLCGSIIAVDFSAALYICLSLFSKCAICCHDDCVLYGKTCGCGQKMVQMVYGLSGSCLFPVLSFFIRYFPDSRSMSRWQEMDCAGGRCRDTCQLNKR